MCVGVLNLPVFSDEVRSAVVVVIVVVVFNEHTRSHSLDDTVSAITTHRSQGETSVRTRRQGI